MKRLLDLPTISETYPNTAIPSWNGVMVPARTPKSVVDKIAAQVIAASHDPDIVEKLAKLGLEPDGTASTADRHLSSAAILITRSCCRAHDFPADLE
jgi:tripartite-type tricarboxylate transporter receptor subunit TctC